MEKRKLSISAMVQKAVKSGKLLGNDQLLSYSPLHKNRWGKSNRELEVRFFKMMQDRQLIEDCGFEEPLVGDTSAYDTNRPECDEYDQLIFNIRGTRSVPNQVRKVVFNTAISVRNCPEKAEDIKEYSKHAKPVLSKAIIRPPVPVKYDFHKREMEMNRILLEAAAEMKTYPRIFDEDTLFEMWLDKRDARRAAAKKKLEKF